MLEKDVENTPANIEILYPKEGATYYQGKFSDYLVFKIKDNERNIQKISLRSNGQIDIDPKNLAVDIYDDIPDTIFTINTIWPRYIEKETVLKIDLEETDEDDFTTNSFEISFNLIPDSVILSNPVISNVEDISPWDDMVNAEVSFNVETISGDLSTILAIRFTRYPNLKVYEPGNYFGGTYFTHNGPYLTSKFYSSKFQTSQTNSELYALIFVKSVVENDEYKFYIYPVGKL